MFTCASACGPAEDEPASQASADASPAGASLPGEAGPCVAAAAKDSPGTISQVVDWVNALPKPLSLPCFLATLPRPLSLHASQSFFSAQPAVGRRSPRIFIFQGLLTLTVVPAGVGSHLLEFGERRAETSSLKAEIEFPVASELGPESPFERVVFQDRYTTCSGCHAGEQRAEDITFARAFVSQALRPLPAERVTLDELLAQSRSCNVDVEPERCAMLNALMEQGEVVDGDFPTTISTFY